MVLAAQLATRGDARPPETNRKKGECNAGHRVEAKRWGPKHQEQVDSWTFTRDVLPQLRGVPLSVMMAATGLSLR